MRSGAGFQIQVTALQQQYLRCNITQHRFKAANLACKYVIDNDRRNRCHEAVLQSVHNPVLQQLSIAISSLQRAVFERTWMGDEANMPQTLQEHKALFDAIRHQDGDAAEQAALTMIASSTRRLKEIT